MTFTPDPEQDATVNVWAATEYLQRHGALMIEEREFSARYLADRFNLSHAKAAELIDGIARGGAPRGGWADTDDVES